MSLTNYAEQILNIYNYYDGAIIVDRKGCIEYYFNNRKDINTLTNDELFGKNLFEIYPDLNIRNSTLMEVIRTGKPLINHYQSLSNYKGESYTAFFSTFPIFESKCIIGAIEVFLYMKNREEHLNIFVMDSELPGAGDTQNLSDIISVSPAMEKLKEHIIAAAQTDSNVLIYGETGTGKELAARAIHTGSRRREQRFLSQNCAAIPDNLLESILFGTVKGGFTNAENRMGLFEAASGGTLFLDEINSMDIRVQAKLLRAIEEQRIVRVGGVEEIPVDVRIITAMNVEPRTCVQSGMLREDLYYRLRVVQLNVPPLRKRKEDIVPLTDHYIAFFNQTMHRQIKGLSPEVMQAFLRYNWPGNIRELRNMIESGFNLCESDQIDLASIDLDTLNAANCTVSSMPEHRVAGGRYPSHGSDTDPAFGTLKDRLHQFERQAILSVMSQCETLSETAVRLGISRQTLNTKTKALGLTNAKIKLIRPDGEENKPCIN